MFKYFLLATFSANLASTTVVANTDLKQLLQRHENKWSPRTEILFPSDVGWKNETERWNIYSGPSYRASIKPGSEADVQKIVKLASAHKVPFLATGGRHGYTATFKVLQNGLELDLSLFKNVRVDSHANTLTVGGGVTFAEILDPVFKAGREIPTGSCSCVGMVGATLGAGVGRYQGLHGLLIDALISVSIVTAKGDIITVSETKHSDLFWGIRGAGFQFGVVLSATYRIVEPTNQGSVTNADFIFPANVNETYFQIHKTFQDNIPAALSLSTLIRYDTISGSAVITLNAVYAGPSVEGEKLLQPFIDLKPTAQRISTVPWNRYLATALFESEPFFCAKGDVHSIYSAGVKNFDVETHISAFNELAQFYSTTPAARESSILIEFFANQAVVAVPSESTAYPWRDIQAQVLILFGWSDASVENSVNRFARRLRRKYAATSGYDSLRVYISYAHGDESLSARYGPSNVARLIGLKKKWDPRNLFRFNNPLPTY